MGTRKARKARGGGEQEARPPPPQQPAGGDLCSWKVPAGTKMTPAYRRLATWLHAFQPVSSPPLRPAREQGLTPSCLPDLDGEGVPLLLDFLTLLRPRGANSHIGCCDPPWSPNRPAPPYWSRAFTCNQHAWRYPAFSDWLPFHVFVSDDWKFLERADHSRVLSCFPGAGHVLCTDWKEQRSSMRLPFNKLYTLGSVLSPLHGLANKPQNGMRWV